MPDIDFFEEIDVSSSLDGTRAPSLLFLPTQPRALLVALHTWSADRFNQVNMVRYCQEREWALLLPEFRGPNLSSNPRALEACGSALARRDIVDAARWVTKERVTQPVPAFLLGGSGGGHMALMVAGCEGFPWQAVSSWCPITDLAAWHGQNAHYAPHLEAICGGSPADEDAMCEYRERSPLSFTENLRSCHLQVAHGRHDATVSWTHSWKIAERTADFPQFYFSLFDGGHDLRASEAFAFFERTLCGTHENQLSR